MKEINGLYAKARIFTDIIEESAYEQIQTFM